MSKLIASEPEYNSVAEVAQRLYWFFFGPMFLVLMLLIIVGREDSHVLGCTIAYLVALALLPIVRWLEMRSGKAQTVDGHPATWADFRNYTLTVLGVGLAAIVAVNLWVNLAR